MSIYLITERSINGEDSFDSCAQVIVMTEAEYDENKEKMLREALQHVKQTAAVNDDCLDTDDMVQDACNNVFGVGHWTAPSYRDVQF